MNDRVKIDWKTMILILGVLVAFLISVKVLTGDEGIAITFTRNTFDGLEISNNSIQKIISTFPDFFSSII